MFGVNVEKYSKCYCAHQMSLAVGYRASLQAIKYYGSYRAPRGTLWIVGVIIYICKKATAFIGYIGQKCLSNFFSKMDSREITRLWRVYKTVHEMVSDRGYLVAKSELEMSLEDFKQTYTTGGVIE
jgi:hypothetical protein